MTAIQKSDASLANLDHETILKLATGDTSRLNAEQKTQLIVQVCKVAGLDPRLTPFEYIKFQGKEVMYARKNAADQLVNVHKIRVGIIGQETVEGVRVVTVSATTADGREQQDIGAVNIKGLAGDALANALMKAVTKAKRRTILSICGLSMLDESEVETIPGATVAPVRRTLDAASTVPAKGSTTVAAQPVQGEWTAQDNVAAAAEILDAEIVAPSLEEQRKSLWRELTARGLTRAAQIAFIGEHRTSPTGGELTAADYAAFFRALDSKPADPTDVPF